MSGLDSRYVTGLELEDYFVSNQNGEALAGGQVTFYVDTARTTAKDVFQLTQDPMTGVYSYAVLPNPITLSGVGTFQNSGGDNVAVYYYPFDEFGNQELYYITVYDAFGNLQFTREAWPFPNDGTGGGGGTQTIFIGLSNQLSNPQFAKINFNTPTLTITIAGAGTTTVAIAPDWDLTIVATGASTVTVTQTPIVGQLKLPYNPPFTLDFVIGANITSCQLIQTLHNNPDWAAPQITGTQGYLSGSILIGNGTSVNMQYVPSVGATQSILNVTNNSGQFVQESATIGLVAANNTDTGATGYDQIIVNIIGTSARISNVQVIPLTTNTSGIQYDQTPVNRQIDHLFNYYNDLLQFKPIKSYLVGWDFPLNPAQFLTHTVASFATGANTSNYVWDQTIVYQSVDNSFTTAATSGGWLELTATADTQLALIQYLSAEEAKNLTSSDLCSVLTGYTTQTGGIPVTISLWSTLGSALPDLKSPNFKSIVATLDANGHPSTLNQPTGNNWVEVSRDGLGSSTTTTSSLGNAKFTLPFNASDLLTAQSFPFAGWIGQHKASTNLTTFFAIVVGTGTITNGSKVRIKSISLVPGNIPTIPEPETLQEVTSDCEYYYSKSFNIATAPAQNVNGHYFQFPATIAGTFSQPSTTVSFPTRMRSGIVTGNITTFSTNAASAQVYDLTALASCTNTTVIDPDETGFYMIFTGAAGTIVGSIMTINWVSDRRLGLT